MVMRIKIFDYKDKLYANIHCHEKTRRNITSKMLENIETKT
jgi:hypothetical protein